MQEIICDTNIWYGLALGHIPNGCWGDNKLLGTYLNLDELLRTEKFLQLGKINLIRQATNACGQNHSMIIQYNPVVYVLNLDGQKISQNLQFDNFLLNFTREFGNEKINDTEAHEILKELVIERRKELEGILAIWEEWLQPIIDKNLKSFPYQELIPLAQEKLVELVESWTLVHLGEKYTISESFDWGQIDLFIQCYAAFLRQVALKAFKLDVNHYFDLFNLIYVTPERRYWTNEKKWNDLIKNVIKIESYIFYPEINEVKE